MESYSFSYLRAYAKLQFHIYLPSGKNVRASERGGNRRKEEEEEKITIDNGHYVGSAAGHHTNSAWTKKCYCRHEHTNTKIN